MEQLVTWLGYNCFLGGLLPIVLVRIGLSLTSTTATFVRLVKDGQLFLYSALLAAAAIGDLMKPPEQLADHGAQTPSPLWLLGLVLCVICSTFFFALAACTSKTNAGKIALISYIFTIGATSLVGGMRYALGLF